MFYPYRSLQLTPTKPQYYGVVSFGSAGAQFNLEFDTGSALLWVESTSCSNCPDNPSFDPSSDTSLTNTGATNGISYQSGSSISGPVWSGPYNVGGIEASSGFVAATSMNGFNAPVSGILGLGLDCVDYECAINALNLDGFGELCRAEDKCKRK